MKVHNRIISIAALSLLVLLASSGIGQAQVGQQPAASAPTDRNLGSVLEPGHAIEEFLPPDQTKSFQIAVPAGSALQFEIERDGSHLTARLLGPDGTEENALESTADDEPTLVLSLVAAASGDRQLQISRQGKNGDGNFRVSASALAPIHPEDEKRVAAEKAYAQGLLLRKDPSADALQRRLGKYQTALALWQEIKDPRGEALVRMRIGGVRLVMNQWKEAVDDLLPAVGLSRAANDRWVEATVLLNLGSAYQGLKDPTRAQDAFLRALELFHTVGDHRKEADTLTYLTNACMATQDLAQALNYQKQALALAREAKDQRGEATSLNYLGYLYSRMDDTAHALESYEQALLACRATGDTKGEAYVLEGIAARYMYSGEPQKAMAYVSQMLDLARATKNRRAEANALAEFGVIHGKLGELQEALNQFTQALPLQKAEGDDGDAGNTLTNIGMIRLYLGNTEKAMAYLWEALPLRQKALDRPGEAHTLTHIGLAYSEQGQWQTALDFYQKALPIHHAALNRAGEADTYEHMGDTHAAMGRRPQALEDYKQALSLYQAIGYTNGQGSVLASIGSTYVSMGETEKAFAALNQALQLTQAAGAQTEEARVLYELARAERSLNHLPEALEKVNAALALTEHMRGGLAASEVRASYLANVRDRYELRIALLMQLHVQHPAQGFDVKALEASEQARARGLLDLLSEAQMDFRKGVDQTLLERERSLETALHAKGEHRIELLARKHTEQEAGNLEKEIQTLTADYEENEAQIRARSPRYAALTQPQILAVTDIQHQVVDPDTLLLEYSLGDEHSFLWVVAPDSLTSYELPKRSQIEETARRAYKELSVKNSAGSHSSTTALSSMLLAPVAGRLDKKRLVIVAEGALQYIPFAALLAPAPISSQPPAPPAGMALKAPSPDRKSAPLLAEHEITNLPSASVLAALRREAMGRGRVPKEVAVLADPVFAASDARVKVRSRRAAGKQNGDTTRQLEHEESFASVSASAEHLTRSVNDLGLQTRGPYLPRLPFSRREAIAILAVTPAGASMEALDFKASRAKAIDSELAQYRILHFATHGLLDEAHPELSGLVFSMVDEQGKPQDGFLELQDIYNLTLSADLVVLSACETGLGKEVRGEGLVGLTRGFMYAGAPRVVASLWNVDDEATAKLMGLFYRAMEQQGMSPEAALRHAQVEISKQKRWHDPYYWAGFVLQGEWK